jgi:hypothetical protein
MKAREASKGISTTVGVERALLCAAFEVALDLVLPLPLPFTVEAPQNV